MVVCVKILWSNYQIWWGPRRPLPLRAEASAGSDAFRAMLRHVWRASLVVLSNWSLPLYHPRAAPSTPGRVQKLEDGGCAFPAVR
jgi:hypothetical protein